MENSKEGGWSNIDQPTKGILLSWCICSIVVAGIISYVISTYSFSSSYSMGVICIAMLTLLSSCCIIYNSFSL